MQDRPNRRDIVLGLGGTLIALATSPAFGAISASAPKIHTRKIPSSGEVLPILGFGTSRVFDVNKAEGKRRPLKEVLSLLFAAGGKLIDTAHNYNRAETVLGDLLSELKLQEKAFTASKVYAAPQSEGEAQIALSFERLQRPVIDLYYVHNFVGLHNQWPTLETLKQDGKIRYTGISHFSAAGIDEITHLLKTGLRPDFVQIPYSLAERHAEKDLLSIAADLGIAVVANQPFAKGSLFKKTAGKPLPEWTAALDIKSWAQFFLKYMTSHPAVNCVIPGTGNPAHAQDNILAGCGHLPNADERARMLHYFENLA